MGRWILVSGLVSSLIDLDVVALVVLKSKRESRLKPFKNLLEMYRKFELFIDTITETGVLSTGLKNTYYCFSSAYSAVLLIFE